MDITLSKTGRSRVTLTFQVGAWTMGPMYVLPEEARAVRHTLEYLYGYNADCFDSMLPLYVVPGFLSRFGRDRKPAGWMGAIIAAGARALAAAIPQEWWLKARYTGFDISGTQPRIYVIVAEYGNSLVRVLIRPSDSGLVAVSYRVLPHRDIPQGSIEASWHTTTHFEDDGLDIETRHFELLGWCSSAGFGISHKATVVIPALGLVVTPDSNDRWYTVKANGDVVLQAEVIR